MMKVVTNQAGEPTGLAGLRLNHSAKVSKGKEM
jgi:hypothetical protein